MLMHGRYLIVHNYLWFIDLPYLSKKIYSRNGLKKSLNITGDEHMKSVADQKLKEIKLFQVMCSLFVYSW